MKFQVLAEIDNISPVVWVELLKIEYGLSYQSRVFF